MPDNSFECGQIVEGFKNLSQSIDAQSKSIDQKFDAQTRWVDEKFAAQREFFSQQLSNHHDYAVDKFQDVDKRVSSITATVESLDRDRSRARGALGAGVTVLTTIGGFVVLAVGALGWLALHGIPEWIKASFK